VDPPASERQEYFYDSPIASKLMEILGQPMEASTTDSLPFTMFIEGLSYDPHPTSDDEKMYLAIEAEDLGVLSSFCVTN